MSVVTENELESNVGGVDYANESVSGRHRSKAKMALARLFRDRHDRRRREEDDDYAVEQMLAEIATFRREADIVTLEPSFRQAQTHGWASWAFRGGMIATAALLLSGKLHEALESLPSHEGPKAASTATTVRNAISYTSLLQTALGRAADVASRYTDPAVLTQRIGHLFDQAARAVAPAGPVAKIPGFAPQYN